MSNMTDSSFIQDLRSVRVFDMAVFDWFFSLLAATIIGKYALMLKGWQDGLLWAVWILCWILFGVFVHKAMGIDTKLGYYLGINKDPRE